MPHTSRFSLALAIAAGCLAAVTISLFADATPPREELAALFARYDRESDGPAKDSARRADRLGRPPEVRDGLAAVLAHGSRVSQGRRARARTADSSPAAARPARRGSVVREQPAVPRHALRQSGRQPVSARELRSLLVERAAGAACDDRLRRRTPARTHDHRQQRALRPRRGRQRARRAARPVCADRVSPRARRQSRARRARARPARPRTCEAARRVPPATGDRGAAGLGAACRHAVDLRCVNS